MVVIDASVWVALFNPDDAFHSLASAWFARHPEPAEAFRAPNIVLAEVGAALARNSGSAEPALEAVAAMRSQGSLVLEPISSVLADRAGVIAIERRVRGCDAIYVALAEALNLPLLTLDRQQAERAAGLIEVVELGGADEA